MSKRGTITLFILGITVMFHQGWLIPRPTHIPLTGMDRYEPERELSWYARLFSRVITTRDWEKDNFRPLEMIYLDPKEERWSW